MAKKNRHCNGGEGGWERWGVGDLERVKRVVGVEVRGAGGMRE